MKRRDSGEKFRLQVFIDVSVKEMIDVIVKQRGVTIAEVVETAVVQFLSPVQREGSNHLSTQMLRAVEQKLEQMEAQLDTQVKRTGKTKAYPRTVSYEELYGKQLAPSNQLPAPAPEPVKAKRSRFAWLKPGLHSPLGFVSLNQIDWPAWIRSLMLMDGATIRWWMYVGGSALLGVVVLAHVGMRIRRGRRALPQTTFGSARWATWKDVQKAGLLYKRGVVCGTFGKHPLMDESEAHVLLVGPTGSGKTRAHIAPSLTRWLDSAIVTDPANGEIYRMTAHSRSAFSAIAVFAPTELNTAKINVLDTVRVKTPHEWGDVLAISKAMGAPHKLKQESETARHFREYGDLMRAAVFLHVLYAERPKSLSGAWQFMTRQRNEDVGFNSCLEAMMQSHHVHDGVHPSIQSVANLIRQVADREQSGIMTTAMAPLSLYEDRLIAAATDQTTFDLQSLQYAEKPTTLYLIAPSPMELVRLHPVFRVVLITVFRHIMAGVPYKFRHRVLGAFDELPAYGYMDVLEQAAPLGRKHGLKFLLSVQDLEQLWETYGERTPIWGNTRIKIFHTPDNDLTAKRISENLLGQTTVEEQIERLSGRRYGWGYSQRSMGTQRHARPLLTTSEVMQLPQFEALVCSSGLPPMRCQKWRWDRDETLAKG